MCFGAADQSGDPALQGVGAFHSILCVLRAFRGDKKGRKPLHHGDTEITEQQWGVKLGHYLELYAAPETKLVGITSGSAYIIGQIHYQVRYR